MIKMQRLCLLFLFLTPLVGEAATYYIDSQTGDDAYNGEYPDSAWASLHKVNDTIFQPGDSLLFKSDGRWEGMLWPKGSGRAAKPIVIAKYGDGALPLIEGNGLVDNVVYLYNQEYWIISELEITNIKPGNKNALLRGVYILGEDYGTLHNITLKNLYIHDVTGTLKAGGNDNLAKENGGIMYEIIGTSVVTTFDSLVIEGCKIKDVDRTGINNKSSWWIRTLHDNTNWTPSTNIIIRHNWIERTGGNGLIIREAAAPLIEYNVFKQCGLKVNGNAMFTFNCDDALVQYNESFLTVYNSGDVDASGFDGDFRCKRSLFQYNYSHDNDGGFMVVVCMGGPTRFNDSTVVRYNISQNDGDHEEGKVFHISGQTTNTFIYNNSIYMKGGTKANAVEHTSWGAWPDSTWYYNNIFYNWSYTRGEYVFNSSTNNFFIANVYYGWHPPNEPDDAQKITDDPQFVNPGGGAIGIDNVAAYQIKSNSPCIDAGVLLPGHSKFDYWGNPVPYAGGAPDRGAHEYQGDPAGVGALIFPPKQFRVMQNYPNPFNPETTIKVELNKAEFVEMVVYNINGQKVHTLFHGAFPAGVHDIVWNGRDETGKPLPSGSYFAAVSTADKRRMIKMLLLR